MIGQTPKTTYYGGEMPDNGTGVDVEYEDAGILWDDNSGILFDDGSLILWSRIISTTPDVGFSFSLPRTSYGGEVEE